MMKLIHLLCVMLTLQDPAPPPGYTWSANIGQPPALEPVTDLFKGVYFGRTIYGQLPPGNYDVATVPFGDNWACPAAGAYKSIKLERSSNISVMAKFPTTEPSAGYLILVRGPYADGAAEGDRSFWMANSMPGGMVRGRISYPIYSHAGARYDRYGNNGYRWTEFGGFPVPPLGTIPVWGAKKLNDADRMPVVACATAPDVTILSNTPNQPIWVAYCLVDMLGRETPVSDPIKVDVSLFPDYSSLLVVNRPGAAPMGACGFRLYAGLSADDLHRQPILNCIGHDDQYLWPLWLQQFLIHSLRTDTPAPTPSTTVKSLLNYPQQRVVAGYNTITQLSRNYDLYCPFVMTYDGANVAREIIGRAKYTHVTTYQGQDLESAIPLMLCNGWKDRITGMSFVSTKASAGLATNDFSGSQSFGCIYERCNFQLQSWDSIGVLVDERSSWQFGGHTASEIQFRDCEISATIPVKIEGNQSAKIRFWNCELGSLGNNTNYPADTAGLCYIQTSCQVRFEGVKGVNGAFRSLVCLCTTESPGNVSVTDCFVDGGCPVYISIGGYLGGKVTFNSGNINTVLPWARLVEAPTALGATAKLNDAGTNPYASCFSAQLNQLSIDSDVPFGEMSVPTEASWLASGLTMNSSELGLNAFDWSKKRKIKFTGGYDSVVINP